MALKHVSSFSVRYDECDMYGHVNHAVYLRYMQEAAFAASAAVGYDAARYEAMGNYWLVRETEIEYYSPLQYGDQVEIVTWVADVRRVRSRRIYQLRRAGSQELAAQAYTDWIYLDRETQRPVSVPEEMVQSFLPEGEAEGTRRAPFPEPPPRPPGCFHQSRRVQWSDVDAAGHVNNAVYLSYLEDCAVQDAVRRGWPVQRMLAEGGFAIVARSYRIEYRGQAVLDDELEVATWISDVRRASAVRHYTIRRANDGELLTRARALWVWIAPTTGRLLRIPQHFIAAFADNIVENQNVMDVS